MEDRKTQVATLAALSRESGAIGKKKKSGYIKQQRDNEVASALLKLRIVFNKLLKDKAREESERLSFQHEHELTKFMKGNHENLKNAWCMLLETRQVTGCDSHASEYEEAKNHIVLLMRVYTESFDELNH